MEQWLSVTVSIRFLKLKRNRLFGVNHPARCMKLQIATARECREVSNLTASLQAHTGHPEMAFLTNSTQIDDVFYLPIFVAATSL
jgi:hypothetical protein